MADLIVLAGCTGTGRTAVVNALLQKRPRMRRVRAHTTQSSGKPSGHIRLEVARFNAWEAAGKFVIVTSPHKRHREGVTQGALLEVINREKPEGVLVIEPPLIEPLAVFLKGAAFSHDRIIPVHIPQPTRGEWRRRLNKQGHGQEAALAIMEREHYWDAFVNRSPFPFHKVPNVMDLGTLNNLVQRFVLARLPRE